MSNEFPLYPELSEEAQNEAQKLMDKFKEKMKNISDEILTELYSDCDVVTYVETDSWTNFRNEILDGFKNYNNRKIQAEYDFKEIRKEIFNQFRDDIIKDLDQDNLDKITQLNKEIDYLR